MPLRGRTVGDAGPYNIVIFIDNIATAKYNEPMRK